MTQDGLVFERQFTDRELFRLIRKYRHCDLLIKYLNDIGYNKLKTFILEESFSTVRIYPVKTGTIGKFLSLECPKNKIILSLGRSSGSSDGFYDGEYHSLSVKCFDKNNKEPFSNGWQTRIKKGFLTDISIVMTKIGSKQRERNLSDDQNETLRIIGSNNSSEYPLLVGQYNRLSQSTNISFILCEGDILTFYAINPNIDIDIIHLRMEIDIFSKDL